MKTIFTLLFSVIIPFSTLIAQQQILNPGFEEWENVWVGTDEPVNWSSIKTSDNSDLNALAPVVWGPSTDAHSGNYSLSLTNVGSIVVATGMITNGRVHSQIPADLSYAYTDMANNDWHGTLTTRPDSVSVWYKCNPESGDFGTIKFLLHTGYAQLPGDENNAIAMAYYEMPSEVVNQWTRVSIPFEYSSSFDPEYILAVLTSGNGTEAIIGSTALFDDIDLIYNPSNLIHLPESSLKLFITNQQLNIITNDTHKNKMYNIKLIDINGRTVIDTQIILDENNKINTSNLLAGIYVVVVRNSEATFTQKILIN